MWPPTILVPRCNRHITTCDGMDAGSAYVTDGGELAEYVAYNDT